MSASPSPSRGPLLTAPRVIAGVLLVIPFIAMLWVNSYARTSPTFIGIPFFYWYQMAWVIGSAVLIGIAYALIRHDERLRRAADLRRQGGTA